MSKIVPEGWSRHKLGDSLSPRPKSKLPSGETNPLGYYNFYVCSHKVLKSFHNEYSSPSILFSTGGEASVHFATERYAFSTDVWATEFEGDICNEYAFRLLEENIKTINYSGFQGSGIKHLDKSFIAKLEFFIPPLPEQKKIASILTSVDEVIENTHKQIDKLQDLKKATMNELLTKGIGHTEFKDSELGRIPKSWKVDKFEQFITLQRGHDLPSQSRLEGKVPIYGSNGTVGFHNQSIVIETGVITGRSGSIGDVYFVVGQYWPLNTTLYVKNFHENDKEFTAYYLIYFNLKRFSSGTGVPTLNRNDVHIEVIKFPPIEEQIEICNVLRSIDKMIKKNQIKLQQYQSLKKSLMHDLLTGKVRVKVN